MKYKLLKELPFMMVGVVFERICKDSKDCCIFGFSYHNCVKHYDSMLFSENENITLCGIINNPEWVEIIVSDVLDVSLTIEEALCKYDNGVCSRESFIRYIGDCR